MTDLDLLMMNGCTKAEAERHLKNGAIVISREDFEKNFGLYMEQWGIDEDAEYRSMLNNKKPVKDWGIVEHNNETWYIMYVL